MNPEEQADLVESLVPLAARLVGAVHDDGPSEVARVLNLLAPAHYPAFAVVLAAMVNPDRSVVELLGWVDWEGMPDVQDSLFMGSFADDDPHEWSDERCRLLHGAWRRRTRDGNQHPNPDQPGDPDEERSGYREWERRRQQRRRDGELTGVNSHHDARAHR